MIPHVYDNGAITLPFINQPTVEEVLIDRIRKKDIHGAQKLIDSVYEAIKRASDECDETECIIYDLGLDQRDTESHYELVQKQAFCDMIFSNCFLCDGSLKFYDQEWVFERVPASFVLYRALKILYSANEYGDTSTTFASALAAFYHKIPVGHVEAGLRTYDMYSPFPEEINRCLVSELATLNFSPTKSNAACKSQIKLCHYRPVFLRQKGV